MKIFLPFNLKSLKVPIKDKQYKDLQYDTKLCDNENAMDSIAGIKSQIRQITLRGLNQSQKYTIRVNTVVNGKTIAYRSEMIEACNKAVPNLEEEDVKINSGS